MGVALGVSLSFFTTIDLLTSIFCGRFPLILYLIVGLLGYLAGRRAIRKQRNGHVYNRTKRFLAMTVLLVGMGSAIQLSTDHPTNHSKCAWRTCNRLAGPGLFVSPFPASPPYCSLLHLCINEASLNAEESAFINQLIEEDQSCYKP